MLAIYQEWAGDNPHRLRQLAILQLLAVGWSQAEIARVLLSDRANIARSIKRAQASIGEWIQTRDNSPEIEFLEYADFL